MSKLQQRAQRADDRAMLRAHAKTDPLKVRQTINGHRVRVPADMKVTKEFGFPGAFDHIDYRDFMLTTFETLVDGCRFCLADNPEVTFKTVEQFRDFVDASWSEGTGGRA